MSLVTDSNPRVAVFCRSFLPISQTFVYDAVTRLTRYRPTVFCLLREHAASFPFDDVRVGWPGYRTTLYAPNFVRAFRREPFSVVHAQFGTSAVYARPYAKRAGLPLVVTFHGYDVPLLTHARRFRGPARQYAWLAPRALREMTLGLCDSSELREMLIDYGVPAEKLRVHLLGIDTQRFQPRNHEAGAHAASVLMVGRMVEKKGFADGIAAFARVAARHDTHLTIIGTGPLEADLHAQVQTLGITDKVTFTGVLPHDRVLALMQEHDVLLAPSVVASNGDRDSGLIVLREAAACGLVAIATRHGGLPDSVEDGVSGYLVEERDVSSMAERLDGLLADASLRARLRTQARDKMVREFDHSVSMPVLEQAYDDARRMYRSVSARPAYQGSRLTVD